MIVFEVDIPADADGDAASAPRHVVVWVTMAWKLPRYPCPRKGSRIRSLVGLGALRGRLGVWPGAQSISPVNPRRGAAWRVLP